MLHYLSIMMAISDIFLLLDGSAEAREKKTQLWQYLKEHTSPSVYRAVRLSLGGITNLHFPQERYRHRGRLPHRPEDFKFN